MLRHNLVQDPILISSRSFLPTVGLLVAQARRSVYLCSFLADVRPSTDDGALRAVAHLLGAAISQGVDVRILLSDVTLGTDQRVANHTFARFVSSRGVPVRMVRDKAMAGSLHAKVVLVDSETAIVGSQNLTSPRNTEIGVAIKSHGAALELEQWFREIWCRGEGL